MAFTSPALGEHGISSVTLSLVSPGPDGVFGTPDDVVVATTTTALDGSYLFTGLSDGKYQVVVTDLNGRLPGYTQTYGLPNTNGNGQVSPFTATITGGNSVLYADFGYADGHLLTVTKTDNVPVGKAVEAGAEMIYTISYSVSGREGVIAPNVIITDPLNPKQLEFIEASSGGMYDTATHVVTWKLGDLKPGDKGTVTVKVRVLKATPNNPVLNNSYIFNTVTIVDDAKVRDEATDVVRVHAEPILSLTKTVDPTGTVKPGDTLKYTLCFANTGNGNANSVVLQDKLPDYVTVVPGSYLPGIIYDSVARTLTLPIGVLPPDMPVVCSDFKVTVDLTLPGVKETPQDWVVHNVATLTSKENPTLTAETTNPLNAFVKPTLVKTADPSGTVKPGDTITYKLCYKNEGNANLTGAVLTDAIPGRTNYVAGSASDGGVYDAGTKTLTWTIGTLGPAASKCVTFKVSIPLTLPGVTEQNQGWTVDNTATLKNDQVSEKKSTTSNPLDATVKPTLTKTADPAGEVHPGDKITYELCYANQGDC